MVNRHSGISSKNVILNVIHLIHQKRKDKVQRHWMTSAIVNTTKQFALLNLFGLNTKNFVSDQNVWNVSTRKIFVMY